MDELKFNENGEAYYEDDHTLDYDTVYDWNNYIDNSPASKEIREIKDTIKYADKGSDKYIKAVNRAVDLGLHFRD